MIGPTSSPTADVPREHAAPSADAVHAVGNLVKTHGPKLHRLALRLCKHQADAADMVQSVFVQALRKWHTFRGHADPGTWLYAIAARACKARTRRKGGIDRRLPALSQLMPWNETTVMRIADAPEGRESKAERNEAVRRVQAEIARLPEHLRLPLVLKDVLEMPAHDVATSLGLALNTVKTRVHRARLALRKAMTARAPAVEAPLPIYEKQVCLDLLQAKMEALDRGGVAAGRKVPQAEVCARCRAVFRELDIVQDACVQIGEGTMPAPLRDQILKALREHARPGENASRTPRRGRKPVAGGRTLSPGARRR